MIFGAKIVIFLETKEYFTHNLVIWRIFIWSFGRFSFGHLADFHLVIWLLPPSAFGSFILTKRFSFSFSLKSPHHPSSLLHLPSAICCLSLYFRSTIRDSRRRHSRNNSSVSRCSRGNAPGQQEPLSETLWQLSDASLQA